jgi:hypothetical protein
VLSDAAEDDSDVADDDSAVVEDDDVGVAVLELTVAVDGLDVLLELLVETVLVFVFRNGKCGKWNGNPGKWNPLPGFPFPFLLLSFEWESESESESLLPLYLLWNSAPSPPALKINVLKLYILFILIYLNKYYQILLIIKLFKYQVKSTNTYK